MVRRMDWVKETDLGSVMGMGWDSGLETVKHSVKVRDLGLLKDWVTGLVRHSAKQMVLKAVAFLPS